MISVMEWLLFKEVFSLEKRQLGENMGLLRSWRTAKWEFSV